MKGETSTMSSDVKGPSLVESLQEIVRQATEPWAEWEIEMIHDVPQDAIDYMSGEPVRCL